MTANKTTIRYLSMAKDCIRLAIETTVKGNLFGVRTYLKFARHWLARADRIIIRKHITECMPKIVQASSENQVIDELMKIYKYSPA